ncbi:dTMP kinase [Novipirellula artificiosorum]|uniref:Thymidylate kinase n=1 Tax=Novipirellula artificiosorum TaxID=2528016 RepID=A0A5C6D322_9BACT|nr:dTMP kinase [Novipirellula artificiosorum]TWU31583.1 Thymidylate kinase [Novipirellula artificiosorum]
MTEMEQQADASSAEPPAGVFLVIDGIDGAGKSTQVGRLADLVRLAGRTVLQSREPTDGPWGRKIRESAISGRMSPEQERHAFLQDRREHVLTRITPALRRGDVVIVDRYFYSTVAYQGLRGGDTEHLLEQMLAEFPIPDLTLFFDLPVPVALTRISENRGDTPNEFEAKEALTKIRSSFQQMASVCPEVCTIDCSGTADDVTRLIAKALLESQVFGKWPNESVVQGTLVALLAEAAA